MCVCVCVCVCVVIYLFGYLFCFGGRGAHNIFYGQREPCIPFSKINACYGCLFSLPPPSSIISYCIMTCLALSVIKSMMNIVVQCLPLNRHWEYDCLSGDNGHWVSLHSARAFEALAIFFIILPVRQRIRSPWHRTDPSRHPCPICLPSYAHNTRTSEHMQLLLLCSVRLQLFLRHTLFNEAFRGKTVGCCVSVFVFACSA